MGVIQNQFNNALTGLTFLAQQTPQWQYGKKVNEARMGLSSMQEGFKKSIASGREKIMDAFRNGDESMQQIASEAQLNLFKEYGKAKSNFLEQNREYLPEQYTEDVYGRSQAQYMARKRAQESAQQSRAEQSAQAMSTAQESAQARDAEIQTIDNNMKNYVEMIREMRANGIIKSNRQAKSMIYKAEHQEDKK